MLQLLCLLLRFYNFCGSSDLISKSHLVSKSPVSNKTTTKKLTTFVSSTETRSVFFFVIEAGHLLVWVIVGVWSWLGSLRWKCLERAGSSIHQFTHFKEILFTTMLPTQMWLGVRSHAQNMLIHSGRYNL